MALKTTYDGIIGSLQSLTPTSFPGLYFKPRSVAGFSSLEDAVRSGQSRLFDLDMVKVHEGPYITNGAMLFQTVEIGRAHV